VIFSALPVYPNSAELSTFVYLYWQQSQQIPDDGLQAVVLHQLPTDVLMGLVSWKIPEHRPFELAVRLKNAPVGQTQLD